jgi:hypothetical protein
MSMKESQRSQLKAREAAAAARVAKAAMQKSRATISIAKEADEETRAKLEALQDKLGDLQEAVLLTDAHDDMEEIETALAMLPTELEKLRTRGYAFRSFLENKVQVLAGQWDETHERVLREIQKRTRELEGESDEAESALRQAAVGRPALVSRADGAISTLESKVNAARSAIAAMYSTLKENVNQTRGQVEEIRWLLDQIDEASFDLHPAEDPVLACEAQYMETEKEGPKGVLYLTDERLIFERKEKVTTKKVLFIATEKETVQELVLEVPVGQIDESKAQDKRKFLGHKEMLELLFAPEADLSGATIRLHGGARNEDWNALLGRVKSGEIDKERARPKDQAVVEAARSVPTKCTTCGATLPAEIVRGQREITCQYCGTVIRL